ncbi:unnamed protein product [Prorocentrum cordatum]|uniref:Uncharacterized protein n=1 Tax=Prorocentrum cordatum TaxID=2364126 RepID=A0ABN9R2J5_9DINO|nr:unnamed protein product [Polarella glacialis]
MVKSIHTPIKKCLHCAAKTFRYRGQKGVAASIVGPEHMSEVSTTQVQCGRRGCRIVHRTNFAWPKKVDTLTFNQMKMQGVYFVTNKLGFTMTYLELQYLRLMRGRLVPGQEVDALQIYEGGDVASKSMHNLRDNLFHALEGFALARRTPDDVVQFDVNFPAGVFTKDRSPVLFPPATECKSICFDGLFGLSRALDPHVDGPRRALGKIRKRTAKKPSGKRSRSKAAKSVVKAKSKKKQLYYKDEDRTATCASKDKIRRTLPGRTGGWQFALDPSTMQVLGAMEHKENECTTDKITLLKAVMGMEGVNADLLIHDDMCHFERSALIHAPEAFAAVKYWVIDKFHRKNHVCSKCVWTHREKIRCKGIPTSASESFNAWIRVVNFFVNSMRPASHRFWVTEFMQFFNDHPEAGMLILAKPRFHKPGRRASQD